MSETAQAVSLEEYLATSYHPDVEYIDGDLKKKGMTGFPHGVVQILLGEWFRAHRKEWNILVSVETRTKVDGERVRLPDVVVVTKGDESRTALVKAPLVAIEVLSPSDSYKDLKERAADLRTMGVENIWLLDEEHRTAEVWTGKQWQLVEDTRINAVSGPVFLDLNWLWAEVDD